jgi:hypothetical protein
MGWWIATSQCDQQDWPEGEQASRLFSEMGS